MATIQIRNVPEDVHRTFTSRAAATGMSLQEYLLQELTRAARRRSPADVVAEVQRRIDEEDGHGFSARSSADVIRDLRDQR